MLAERMAIVTPEENTGSRNSAALPSSAKPGPVHRLHVRGVARQLAHRRVPLSLRQQALQERLLADELLQTLIERGRIGVEEFLARNAAERAAAVREGNEPVPHVAMPRMNDDLDLVAIEGAVAER